MIIRILWKLISCCGLLIFFLTHQLAYSDDSVSLLRSNSDHPPQVLATIKPLQLIAQAITNGVSQVQVLLPTGASPHTYTMTFNDIKKLKSANLIIWVGAPLEHFLTTLIDKLDAEKISMVKLPNIKLIGGSLKYGKTNPHIWLDPENVIKFATVLTDKLTSLDHNKENIKKYKDNLDHFIKHLHIETKKLKVTLKPYANLHFIVFHDAFSYFEEYFGLQPAQYFTVNPQQQPSVKKLSQLHHLVESKQVGVIFTEPAFQPRSLKLFKQEFPNVVIQAIDPLAVQAPVDQTGYFVFLKQVSNSFIKGFRAIKNKE